MLNISASPFDYDHAAGRIETLKTNTAKYKIPVFYFGYNNFMRDDTSQ